MLNLRLFTIRLGSYRFSPGVIPTIVTILLLYLLFSLGQWQLSRAQFKENLKQQITERSKQAPVELELLPSEDSDRQFVPVKLSGRFKADKSFLLDNKVINQQAGYEVITPFETTNGKWLLVDRGWIQGERYRADLPEFETPSNSVELSGFVRTPHKKVFMLEDQQYDTSSWPVVIQSVNINDISKLLNLELLSYVVFLNQDSAAGFNRHWPAYRIDSEKHVGYSIQWFALFSVLLAIYLLVNTKRNEDHE